MKAEVLKERNLERECIFSASRSSGPGGQNVNKVNTRIELRFNISKSVLLTIEEKRLLLDKLVNRINSSGDLIIVCQTERSQLKNKEKAVERFFILIAKSLTIRAARISTKPTAGSKRVRLESKKKRSEIKKSRSDLIRGMEDI